MHFCLDAEHPISASQHQKLAVTDDRLAFCGGIDLGQWRWDTPEHRIDDERRKDTRGTSYPPFHDMQMAVDGEAANALGQVARECWKLASDFEPYDAASIDDGYPWPPELAPAFEDIDVEIARKLPTYGDRDDVREVETRSASALHLHRKSVSELRPSV